MYNIQNMYCDIKKYICKFHIEIYCYYESSVGNDGENIKMNEKFSSKRSKNRKSRKLVSRAGKNTWKKLIEKLKNKQKMLLTKGGSLKA